MRIYEEFEKLHDALMWLIMGSESNEKRNDLKHNMDLLVTIEKKIDEMWEHTEFTFKAWEDNDSFQVELFPVVPKGYCADTMKICNDFGNIYIPYWNQTVKSFKMLDIYRR